MISKFKNGSIKMTKKGALSCLVASAVILSSGVVLFNNSGSVPVSAATKAEVNFISDKLDMNFDDVNQAAKYTEFDFKVPNYIGEGNTYSYTEIQNIDESKVLSMIYIGNTKSEFKLQVFKENPEETLKSIARFYHGHEGNTTVESNPLKLGNIDGQEIVVKNLMLESDEVKSFVWKENNVWYAITYYINSFDSILMDMNQEEVQKIAESFVDLSQMDTAKYPAESEDGTEKINIYTQEDLSKAKESLGFEPKVLMSVGDKLELSRIGADKTENGATVTCRYSADSNKYLMFNQTKGEKDSRSVKDIVEDSANEFRKDLNTKVESGKLEGVDVEAYRFSEAQTEHGNTYTHVNYYWNEGDISYYINVFNFDEGNNKFDINYYDNIVKELINEK